MKVYEIKELKCGFCLKEFQVDGSGKKLGISGMNGFICIPCIRRCKLILDLDRTSPPLPEGA